jgi:Myosin heavy chain
MTVSTEDSSLLGALYSCLFCHITAVTNMFMCEPLQGFGMNSGSCLDIGFKIFLCVHHMIFNITKHRFYVIILKQ